MNKFEWRSYRGASAAPGWIDDLVVKPTVRNQLLREFRRLSELVESGHYFGEGAKAIEEHRLEAYRHDLSLWQDPEAVLCLLKSRAGRLILGPKSLKEAILALEVEVA